MVSQWLFFVTLALACAVFPVFQCFHLRIMVDQSDFHLKHSYGRYVGSEYDQSIPLAETRGDKETTITSTFLTQPGVQRHECIGKERLLSILRAAETERENACSVLYREPRFRESSRLHTMSTNTPKSPKTKCDYEELCDILPSWHNISQLYGHKPVILGLDTCQQYRELLLPNRNRGVPIKPMIRVAGLYNSGTNALASMFYLNFNNNNSNTVPVSDHDAFLVPWGKHVPAKYRLRNTYPANNTESKDHVLPVVVVRDPYRWMNSMCKTRYSVRLDQRYHCPYLFTTSRYGGPNRTYQVVDEMDQAVNLNISEIYESAAHMWVEWHKQYLEADFPRLVIRFEDLLFHTDVVMQSIGECAGLSLPDRLSYQLSASKNHGNPANFVSAIIKYGTSVGRHGRMAEESFDFSKTALDPKLMDVLRYTYGDYSSS